MKTLLLLICLVILIPSAARAQYRYNTYSLNSSTNATIATNGTATFGGAVDVAASTRADLWMAFSLVGVGTNPVVAGCTNLVTTPFDTSLDGTYWRSNAFTLSVRASSNSVVWDSTNVSITNVVWIRAGLTTNGNAAIVTNIIFKIGSKVGL